MTDPLDFEATPLRVRELVRRGAIPADRFDDAVTLLRGPHDPRRALQVVLLALATALLVAGVAFFVAANWQALGRFARLGAVCGSVLAAVAVALVVGPRSTGGRAALTVAGLVVGPSLFLFGQTYNTGADAWQLFAGWLVLIVPFALAARFAGLWWTVLLLAHTTFVLVVDQAFDLRRDDDAAIWLPFLVVLDVVVLVLSDLVGRRVGRRAGRRVGSRSADRRALPRGIAVILALTACGCVVVGLVGDGHRGTSFAWFVVDVVVAVGAALLLVGQRRRDLLRAAVGLFVVGVGAATGVGRLLFDVLDLELAGVFLVGFFVIAFVAGGSALLRHWHTSSGALAEDEP